DRPVRFVVFADVLELKTFRQIEIKLNCRQLPRPANRVLDTNVDLWPVERRFAFNTLVRNATTVQGVLERRFAIFPIFVRAEKETVVIAPDGEIDLVVLKAKHVVDVEGEVDATDNLGAHRFRRAEDVRIVLRKPARANQPMQRAGKLSSITRAELGVTQRQIAIGMLRRLIDPDVERAVHRLDAKLLLFELHRREHRVDVVDFVPAREPKLALGDVWREDQTIAAQRQLLA